jgi:membrane protein YqaA with SNARE-associated domain
MIRAAASIAGLRTAAVGVAAAFFQSANRASGRSNPFLHFLLHFGFFGLLLVSIIDSSFVPLPLPGVTDIMIIVMAAAHENWFLLVLLASIGSAMGGYFSYKVGHSGGMAFLEKRVPPRIFKTVTHWMENHAILAVALPAILPPPAPLSPFVLAAGALNMSRRKFLWTFTISRAIRHAAAAWLGIRYGRMVIRLWNGISARYAMPLLIAFWAIVILSCGIGFWRLYKTSRTLSEHHALASTGIVPRARVCVVLNC